MKGIAIKLDWLKARPWRTFFPGVIVFAVITIFLTRHPFNFSTSLAQAISGISTWSMIVLIVGSRIGGKVLCLEDYVDIHQAGTVMLMNSGPAFISVFAGNLQEKAYFILMIFSMLPCLAVATIARHALFSQEEWKAAARKVR